MSFTCFQRLPFELRRTIWRHTLPSPRVIDVTARTNVSSYNRLRLRFPEQFTSSAPIPVALHVTRESRAVAQERYSLVFGTARTSGGRIWIDFKSDFLLLDNDDGEGLSTLSHEWRAGERSLIRLCDPVEIGRVHNLIICGLKFTLNQVPVLQRKPTPLTATCNMSIAEWKSIKRVYRDVSGPSTSLFSGARNRDSEWDTDPEIVARFSQSSKLVSSLEMINCPADVTKLQLLWQFDSSPKDPLGLVFHFGRRSSQPAGIAFPMI